MYNKKLCQREKIKKSEKFSDFNLRRKSLLFKACFFR